MYIVETKPFDKEVWKKAPVEFAEIEDAEKYAFMSVIDKKCENARVVDERYRRGRVSK